MPELSVAPALGFNLPQYGKDAFTPHFQVPEFHPTPTPAPYVAPIGAIVQSGIQSYEQARDYHDRASARLAADVTNRQYLQAQGVDTSALADPTAPGLGSQALASVGHLFDGTLGEHANDPKPAGALSTMKPYDPSTGSFSVGPSGATYQPFRRDPAQDERTRAETRRINAATDLTEAQARDAAAPMQGTVHPFTGQIMGGGTPSPAGTPSDPNALPTAPSPANPSLLTAPGGAAAPAPNSTVTTRDTIYSPGEKHSDPDTDAGRTSTGGPLVEASPAMAGTVAVDPSKIPYGSIIKRANGQVYVAADQGADVINMKASQGRANVLDFVSKKPLPDYGANQIIAPMGDYVRLSRAEKEEYHRKAAATYGAPATADASTPATAPAPQPAPVPTAAQITAATPPDIAAGAPTPPPLPVLARAPAVFTDSARPLALSDTRVSGASAPALSLAMESLPALNAPPAAPVPFGALASQVPPATDQPVGVQDRPVRKALAVTPDPASIPATPVGQGLANPPPAAAPARGPYGGTLLPNGNEETPFGTILNPAVYSQRTVRRVVLPDGGVQLVDDPNGKFFAPYVKPPRVADAVIDPATGQPIPGLTMEGKQITSRGATPATPMTTADGATVPGMMMVNGKAVRLPAVKTDTASADVSDLSPEQQLQTRAVAREVAGVKGAADPTTINLVADLFRQGHDLADVRGMVASLKQTTAVSAQYSADPQVKMYKTTLANYKSVADIADTARANPESTSPQKDASLLFAYVKADNPTMGVTEASFKAAASAGTLQDTLEQLGYKITLTNSKLTQQQRDGFKDAALLKLAGQRETYDQARERFGDMAQSGGLKPDLVLGRDVKPYTEAELNKARGVAPSAPVAPTAPAPTASPAAVAPTGPSPAATPAVTSTAAAVQVHSQAEYDGLPSGTRYLDSNGKLAKKP